MAYILIFITAIFVNNIVLSQFLGICPFLGVSKKVETACGMGAAVAFVLTIATIVTYLIQIYVLEAFGLEYLQTIAFILVIAALVQMVEIILKKVSPSLYQALGVFLPLITTNCCILGVAINMYQLIGLKAEIPFTEPAVDDTDVYLYSRCCDQTSYDPESNRYLGSLVQNGKELQSDNSRLGYCAMANDNIVIGIARDEKVKDYCIEQKGSFFRQFILVSDGVLPGRFYLHGKVERRALARMGKKLFYVESKGKETMWDFADALREYGFIDAIYITGGTDYCFYRTADGTAHDIGDKHKHPDGHKGKGIVPWVVFKKR